MTSDIIDRIDRYASAETPLKCPHCDRNYHNLPLRQNVADMLAAHYLDVNYDPITDDSPIVCVGADMYGPPRPPRPSQSRGSGFAITGSFIDDGPLFVPQDSGYTYTSNYTYIEHFDGPAFASALEKAQAVVTSMHEALQILTLSAWETPTLKVDLWLPGDSPPPCSDIDGHVIEFGPSTWFVEHTSAPEEEFDWPEINSDIPLLKSPGYDFSKIKQDLEKPYWLQESKGNNK
jgi:hypothetical protein